MHEVLVAFGCTFAFVGLKALQQRNVAFDNYKWVLPTSMLMAFVEYGTIIVVVKAGYSVPLMLGIGLGAGLGALGAMLFHKRYVKKKEE